MKILFIVVLALNLLFESLAALSLIAGPDGISAAGQGSQWSMHYGFAALAVASASVWVWFQRTDLAAVTAVLGVLLTFHTGLTISLAVAGDQMPGTILHAVMAVLCLIAFTQRQRIVSA